MLIPFPSAWRASAAWSTLSWGSGWRGARPGAGAASYSRGAETPCYWEGLGPAQNFTRGSQPNVIQ